MSTYIISADRTAGAGDCLDKICEVIGKGGHNVKKGPVDPGIEAYFAKTVENKSEIGVAVINGLCLGTMHSMYDDLIKTGKMEHIVFAIPFPLMGGSNFHKKEDLTDESKKLRVVHDGTNWPESYYKDDGKWTVDEAFQQYPGIDYVYGDTCEDCAQAILDGNFGGSGDGDESSDSSSEGETQLMSGWESLCDLVKPYDGEIVLLVRGDTVVCKRIEIPQWSAIWAYEGVNVVDDSVTVTDYSPEIYNTVEVLWGANFDNKTTLCFERHKELFGERVTTIEATKKVSQEEYDAFQEKHSSSGSGSSSGSTSSSSSSTSSSAEIDWNYAKDVVVNKSKISENSSGGGSGGVIENTVPERLSPETPVASGSEKELRPQYTGNKYAVEYQQKQDKMYGKIANNTVKYIKKKSDK